MRAMLEAMARIAPLQPNEAMARTYPHLVPQPNCKKQNFARPKLDFFYVDPRFETARFSSAFNLCALTSPETWDRASTTTTTGFHNLNLKFGVGEISSESPLYCSVFCSKFRAPHRGTSLGPLVCGAHKQGGFKVRRFFLEDWFTSKFVFCDFFI